MLENLKSLNAWIRGVFAPEPPAPFDMPEPPAEPPAAVPALPKLAFRVGGATVTGPRSKNDDAYRIDGHAGLIAVSDGVGGAPDGDVMSRVATGRALEAYAETRDLAAAFTAANDTAVHVAHLIDNSTCGATLLLAAFDQERLAVAWAGDTVAYRVREGLLEQLVRTERAEGTNALTSAIGYERGLAPSLEIYDMRAGDRFLFCTDGVWEPYLGVIGTDRLVERLSEHDNAPLLAHAIVEEAAAAGTDNATAVVLVAGAREAAERPETAR